MQDNRSTPKVNFRHTVISQLLRFVLTVLSMSLVLFGSAGRLDWFSAWVYLAVYVMSFIVNFVIVLPRDPELTDERERSQVRIAQWERSITALLAFLTFATLAVAGFQVRSQWAPLLPVWARIVGLILLVLGNSLTSWGLAANQYFQTNVYFDSEISHQPIASGPYRYIRHPGYGGLAVSALATPLLLGTGYALVPAAVTVALLVAYTSLEDQTLQIELEGYDQYSLRVRYRLLPGVW